MILLPLIVRTPSSSPSLVTIRLLRMDTSFMLMP
jgi:hypothetical protein